jgi:hypothetical protein
VTLARRLWRSPALRFLALGAALFAIESIARSRLRTERPLTVSRATVHALRDELRASLRREPTRAELTARLGAWADDERLYREAVDRRVWEGDPVLRQRLVERAAWILRGEAPTAEPTPQDLARTLARHPDRYLVPSRVSFTQVFVSRAAHPSDAPAVMVSLADRIARGDDPASLGDAPPFGREALARNDASLASEYGSAFAEALRELPVGAWSPPIETRFGLHRVRITARTPPSTLTVPQAGARLVADWREDQREALDRSVRDRLRARLPLRLEGGDDP